VETPTIVDGKLLRADGLPVAGAEVTLTITSDEKDDRFSEAHGKPSFITMSKEDGSFEFPKVPLGKYRLLATTREYGGSALVSPGYRQEPSLMFLLKPAQVIHGIVTDANQKPLANVAVDTLFPLQFSSRTRTNSDGSFNALVPKDREENVPDLPDGLVFLRAGFAPTFVESKGLSDAPLNVILRNGGCISGKVTLEGRPMAGIRVVANTHYLRYFRPYNATTDESGQYRLEGLGVGAYAATVDDLRYHVQTKSDIIVRDNQEASGTDFTLSQAGIITGIVTDKDTGAPVPDAELLLGGEPNGDYVFLWMLGLEREPMKTDERGRFEVRSLPPGIYQLSPYRTGEYIFSDEDVKKDIYLEAGKEVHVDFSFQRGATSTVFLHDEAGRTVSGAHMTNRHEEVAPGKYRVYGLPLGEYIPGPSRPGFFLTTFTKTDITSFKDNPEIDLTMARGISICGRVVDPQGNGVTGAVVRSTDVDNSGQTTVGLFAVTGKDGAFSLEGLSSKTAFQSRLIRIVAEGYDDSGSQEVEKAGLPCVFTIKPQKVPLPETHFIAGRVINDLGEPVAKADVTVSQAEKNVTTDDNGAFHFDGLSEGYLDLFAESPFGEMTEYSVQSPVDHDNVEVKIERYAHIRGSVVDKTTGGAVPVFSVHVLSDRLIYRSMWSKDTIGTAGSFAMDVIPNANLEITTKVKGYMVSEPAKLNLKPSENAFNIKFELVKAGMIAGVLRDSISSAPIANAVIYELHEFGPDNPGATCGTLEKLTVTDANGRFEIDNVDHSPLSLYVVHGDYAVEIVRDVEVESEKLATIAILLHPGGAIKGHVYGVGGVGLPNVEVFLHDQSRRDCLFVKDHFLYLKTISGPGGSYEIKGIMPGKVRFGVVIYDSPSKHRTYGKTRCIKDGETLSVDFKPDDPPEECLGDPCECSET